MHQEMHQRMGTPRQGGRASVGGGPYRARDGAIFGVCKGLARHFDIDTIWIRLAFVAAVFFSALWPAIAVYVVAALIMKLEPVVPLESESDAEFYHAYSNSRTMALHRLKRTFDNLERRIQRMEDIVTDRSYDWDRRFRESE